MSQRENHLNERDTPGEDTPYANTNSDRYGIPQSDKFKVFRHIGLLTWKNFLLQKRNWKATVCQMVSPLILCFILFAWQIVANSIAEKTLLDPPITPVSGLPKCVPKARGENCTTLGIALIVTYHFIIGFIFLFFARETQPTGLIMSFNIYKLKQDTQWGKISNTSITEVILHRSTTIS